MKAIILLAGYATRLYPLTLNTPKALLEIGGRTILDAIFDELETIPEIDGIHLVTNHKFHPHFCHWRETRPCSKPIHILDDGTTCDEGKLGAIGDIQLVLQHYALDDDLLIMAGDMIFTFALRDFYQFYRTVQQDCICVHRVDEMGRLRRMAVALLDEKGRVKDLAEKPETPRSNVGVEAFYIYRRDTLPLFTQYLEEGNKPDAPGYFPAWLHTRKQVYAYAFEGECYDIGTPETYREVQEKFQTPADGRTPPLR